MMTGPPVGAITTVVLLAPVTYSLAVRLALLSVDTQGQNRVSASTYISSLLSGSVIWIEIQGLVKMNQ